MSDEIRRKGKDFAEFITGLSDEQIAEGNKANYDAAKEEFERFKSEYSQGNCYLCHKKLNSFSKKTPCIHWLLKPKGFKKKDLVAISEKYGYFQIQSLLRWYANEEYFGKNINNLKDEGSGNKLFEVTIKYKNIEWSFSCAESDYNGHEKSQHSKHAHYHFQMRVDKRPFINYNDFHLPFTEMDILNIEAMKFDAAKVKQRYTFGEGMDELMSDSSFLENVITGEAYKKGEKESEAPFKIDSFACAEAGKEINGEDFYEIIQEAKSKGVPVASLLHKLPNATAEIIVTPGPGVVEQAPRSGGKNKKKT